MSVLQRKYAINISDHAPAVALALVLSVDLFLFQNLVPTVAFVVGLESGQLCI
jgi:hypothetical protein